MKSSHRQLDTQSSSQRKGQAGNGDLDGVVGSIRAPKVIQDLIPGTYECYPI